jgi:diguanylate cyclase (GGDEF)-like protein
MVNDTYGHQIGDEVLKDISKIALDNVREQDITTRWGGEEFFILLPQTNLSGAIIVANKIRTSTENHIFTEKSIKITVSFGVAEFCIESDDEKTIISKVDKLLYEAKRTGKNKVMC